MLNFTPHPITVRRADGTEVTYQPSGTVARLAVEYTEAGKVYGLPVVSRVLGQPEGLPEPGTPCLVSALVAGAVPGRPGVYAPDTGPTAIRDGAERMKFCGLGIFIEP
jgi:hypothetical protein